MSMATYFQISVMTMVLTTTYHQPSNDDYSYVDDRECTPSQWYDSFHLERSPLTLTFQLKTGTLFQ